MVPIEIPEGSDSSIAEDMYEDMKNTWKAYRQKLRDLPGDLEGCLESLQILHTTCSHPNHSLLPPSDPEPPADASADKAPPETGVMNGVS